MDRDVLYFELGDLAFDGENIAEAYEYYKRAIEEGADSAEVFFKKGHMAALLSTKEQFRIKEMLVGMRKAIEEKAAELPKYIDTLIELTERYLNRRAEEFYFANREGKLSDLNLYLHKNADKAALLSLEAGEFALQHTGEELERRIAAMKLICTALHFLSIDFTYKGEKGTVFCGREFDDKKAYIERYDELCYFIRSYEPSFRKEDENPINRVDPQREEETYENQRIRIHIAYQRYRDREFDMRRKEEKKAKEMELLKERWKTHPEEYEKYLTQLEEDRRRNQAFLKKLKEYDAIIDEIYSARQQMYLNAGTIFGKRARARRAAEQKIADLNYLLASEYSDWSEFR